MRHCDHCNEEIAKPAVVHISEDPGEPNGLNLSFCDWECLTAWASRLRGQLLMPDPDSPFFEDELHRMEALEAESRSSHD
jgi:hypothetical protein